MSPSGFLSAALETAWATFHYLLAYRLVAVLAPVASAALIAFARPGRWRGWLGDPSPLRRVLGAAVLGFTRPLARSEIERNLRLLDGRPLETVSYLTVSHNLTVYYLFLIGPLLGRDALLSHAVGGLAFFACATPLARWLGIEGGNTARPSEPGESPLWKEVAGEASRAVGFFAYGLLLGGLIAAWGLSQWAFVPTHVSQSPLVSQLANAVFGGVASVVLWMWPVANLFVGTYLWKTGLAHAGLVTFFYASAVSPQRLRLYAKVLGRERAIRLGAALTLGALAAGLTTAVLFHLFDLTIHYRLLPEQLL